MADYLKEVGEYLEKNTWEIEENSNMGYSLQGLNGMISKMVSKGFWKDNIYTKKIKDAHSAGLLHIHDLNSVSAYCCGFDLKDFLLKGFRGVQGKIACAPPKHFRSALGQIVNFLFSVQGEVAGAVAFSNFDTLLAPFIFADNIKDFKTVKKELRSFVFNMNVPTRVSFQQPFSNLTFDLICPDHMRTQVVVSPLEGFEKSYGDFQPQMDMINKAFWEIMTEGDANGNMFPFPIPTYNITKEFLWESQKYNPLWKLTDKFGVPYFGNYVGSGMDENQITSMCCRLRIDRKQLQKRSGGLFSSIGLTGSVGVVTLNLPRYASIARCVGGEHISERVKVFKRLLSEYTDLACYSLNIKRKMVEDFTEKGLYPYLKYYLGDIKKRFDKYWYNHFSTVGIVGMHEACETLLGEGIDSKLGQTITIETMKNIKKELLIAQMRYGDLFNLEATPAESTAYRLAQKDISDKDYYTNSTNLPVEFTDDIGFAMRHQETIQREYTGGAVFHTMLGESIGVEGTKALVKTIIMESSLPYISITPTFSICEKCGYIPGHVEICEKCGGKAETYSRVTGYIRPISSWNVGKKIEYKDRKNYKIK